MAEVLEVVLTPPSQYLSLAYSWHVHQWRVEVGVYMVDIQWLSHSGTGGGADPTTTVPEYCLFISCTAAEGGVWRR